MIRIVIENLLLFLAPTAIYIAYVYLSQQGQTPGKQILAEAPLAWLAAVGASLVVATMVLFGSTDGGKPDQGYQPPGLKDGKVVPGHQQ